MDIFVRKPILYLVVPCYNEQEVLTDTVSELTNLFETMCEKEDISCESRMMFVNDGSRDNTWAIIGDLYKNNQFVCGLNLAGNVGHQNALFAGLMCAKNHADIVVSIDADLQDDISVIPQMVAEYKNGIDIVYGVRRERKTDTWFKRNTALAFYRLMNALGVNTVYNHADFRLLSKRALFQLEQYKERNLFLRGMIPLLGYHTSKVYYDRSARLAGESKYPFRKMLNFAIDGITSFSIKPVRMLVMAGFVFVLIALGISVWALVALLNHKTVQGWTSLMISLWFIGGSMLMGMGVVGEYIGKMYMEVKSRPRYNVESRLMK